MEIFGNKNVHHQVTYHHKVGNILHIQKQEGICVFMMNSLFFLFLFFWPQQSAYGILVPQSEVKSLSRFRLCDPMDCNLPGSSVHGILQPRVLEWGAVSFSRVNQRSNLGPQQWKGGVLTTGPLGKSLFMYLGTEKKVKSEISKYYIGLC